MSKEIIIPQILKGDIGEGNKTRLVPRLRFPEYKDDGVWREKTLGSISERVHEKVGNIKLTTVSISAGKGFVSQSERFSRDISGQQYKNYIILNEGDFAYNKGNSKKFPQGCIYKLKEFKQVAAPNAFICFRLKSDFIAGFYQGYFDNNYHGAQLQKFITSGARMDGLLNIRPADFFSIILPTPKREQEQQKIASCLSLLDELVAAESQKLEALKAHKKGLMQQIFPAEGEPVPKLRFAEFKDSEEWVVEPLNDLYSFKSTNTFIRDNLNYESGFVKNIHYGDIHKKFSSLFDISKESVPYINPDLPIENIKLECYCKEGDLIFADASEDLKDVGKCIEVVYLNNEKVLSGLHTLLARQKKARFIIGFGGLLFLSNRIRTQIQREAQGAKVLGISATRLSNILVCYTPNKKEQQKIASCLSSLDELIVAQTQKIKALKTHKRGLMQGLFPNTNETKP